MPRSMVFLCVFALLAFGVAGSAGAGTGLTEKGMAGKRSVLAAGFDRQHGPHSQIECSVTSTGPNTNLDCDDPFPNNEPDIEVNPSNPQHMIASSNDFGTCCDQFYTSFDGGQTWTTGNMSREKPQKIGSDPVTVFDRKHGVAIHASLSFSVQHAGGREACDGDVVVSISRDGGLVWEIPVLVDDGIGCDLSKTQIFHDKEWIVTDNNSSSPFYGRTYLTWTAFDSINGMYASSPIFESHSDDGGKNWSKPQEISGSNADLCTFQETGPATECDENQFSVPTVGPDGTVYVAFENEQNQAEWEAPGLFDDQYLLVKSPNGGQTWSSPTSIVDVEDGSNDYPANVDGRQTLTGYQVRVNSAGNIVASPTDGKLYLVFSDNRNGVHNSPNPVTNTDVFLMVGTKQPNGSISWTGPTLVDSGAGDQWFPWVEVDPTNGSIGILYHDRGASNTALYNTALAEGSPPGAFVKTTVSTAPSNPTDSLFFQAGVPGCEKCATFHGDYNNVSYGTDGVARMTWTDMRDFVASGPFGTGFAQFIYYGSK
jgi:hypothetical protein